MLSINVTQTNDNNSYFLAFTDSNGPGRTLRTGGIAYNPYKDEVQVSSILSSGACEFGSVSGNGAGLSHLRSDELNFSWITLGSAALALGSATTTLAGLTSVTSNSFIGDLTGEASSAYKVSLSSKNVFTHGVLNYLAFSDLSTQAPFSDTNLLQYYTGLHFNEFQAELNSPNLRLSGNAVVGGLGIGNTLPIPYCKIDLGNSFGSGDAARKLALYYDGTYFAGFGMSGNTMEFSVDRTTGQAPQMVLKGNGRVGIGTTSPATALEVAGTIMSSHLRVYDGLEAGSGYDPNRYGAVQIVESAGTSMVGYVRAGHYVVASGFLAGSNDFAIAGWSLAGTGVRLVQGAFAWTSTSDERTKDITNELSNVLEKLSGIRCVRFRYKTDCEKDMYGRCQYERDRIGFIAQDVQSAFPEAVHISAGLLGLTYQDMIVVNTAALKELMVDVKELRARVKRLEDARPWFRGHARTRQIEERLRRLEEQK
jgi:hypothetical protein